MRTLSNGFYEFQRKSSDIFGDKYIFQLRSESETHLKILVVAQLHTHVAQAAQHGVPIKNQLRPTLYVYPVGRHSSFI